ncbi:MAG: beta-lactamase family protein [Alphaproteobacteria bacterium]|nr:beta-lactamase family protein [Alphaproteobacteria bacterium]MBU1516110.1 beta-lactamase family protein [Alphaproteobacteria bacterium]MBU2092675.1 beta-lactamase family protein [Alphaproteobacteria bacterium]MBU2153800.1 beta-lactamase family protein [Alphaproteobacteria bacterium]MBU2308428.1 beta-lactamase family protein [Alphaproteobacteria bacterium]
MAQPNIAGVVDPAFARVREVFAANFAEDAAFREIGAAVAVHAGGRPVVDLWGGVADPATGRAWTPDTLVNVWSTTKGVMAIALAQLVDSGALDYDAPVARYWPEFAQAGKGEITVAQVLSHQSGLNGFAAPTTLEDFGDWETVTGRLAAQAPFWPPGTATSYHAMTYGFLAGEIARRITGLSPRALVASAIAGPLDADLQIGATHGDWPRIAPLTPPAPAQAGGPAPHAWALHGVMNPALKGEDANSPGWRMAQIPAGNGHATARALSRLYGAVGNGGTIDGCRLLSPGVIDAMRAPRSTRDDLLLGPGAWAAGFMINRGGLFGPGEGAFGHCGWGGSYAYADPDPDLGLGVGYTPNRMFGSILQDPRGVALAHAIAECAGRAGA